METGPAAPGGLGLRTRIVAITATVFVLGAVAIIWATTLLFMTANSQALQSRSMAIANGLTVQLNRLQSLGLGVEDLIGFEQQCRDVVTAYDGVAFAMVIANDGRVLFHSDTEMMGWTLHDLGIHLQTGRDASEIGTINGKEFLISAVPVLSPDSAPVGEVVIGVAESRIAAAGRQMALMGAGVGFLALVICIGVLVAALSWTVTRPLSRLMEAVTAFRHDRRPHDLPDVARSDEIGQLAAAFQDMSLRLSDVIAKERKARQQSEAANKAKSNFLANVSHELRTPLNAIIGFSEMMERETFGPLGSPRYAGYLNDIGGSARHLLCLINEILDMAKVEAGRLELNEERICIREVVEEAVRLVADRAAKAGLDLQVAMPGTLPVLVADPVRVRQILLNLLSNAVKFTGTGGRVTIACAVDGGGGLVIRVTDTGAGMTPEELTEAMQPFGQVDDDLNRRHDGTGLGLPLTAALVAEHGGWFKMDSVKGQGTTATVVFGADRVRDGADAVLTA